VNGGAVSEFAPPWTCYAGGKTMPAAGASFFLGLTTVDSSPSAARCKAKVILREWKVTADDASTALLLISELVTNAAEFGIVPGIPDPAEISLALWRLRGLLVIEVSDQSPKLPSQRPAGPDALRGRGLNLVSQLSREWHYYVPRPGWKTVYCVVAIEDST
jgi:anti-sigma regulatory factor (Ser/Thr protein kinase)